MDKRLNLGILAIICVVYYFVYNTSIGALIFGPVEILVAFLHEFGHASMALLTGGAVHALQVNPDGSGVTTTSGGKIALITMGGYIGSCVFSNILVRASLSSFSKWVCYLLAATAVFSAVHWFSTTTNLIILLIYAIGFVIIGKIPIVNSILLQFVGVACVVRVLQDFKIGPSSDLAAFQSNVGILPYDAWMYLWLVIAILITLLNIRLILRSNVSKLQK
jgi:hypothetical protein